MMDIASAPSQVIGLINRTVNSGLRNPWTKPNATNQPPAGTQPTLPASPQAREVLAGYDLEHISPREFSELVQKLQNSGAVSAADAKDLAQIRLLLDAQQAHADEPINLVDFLQQRLEKLVQAGADLTPVQNQIAWVQKLLAVQNSSENDCVNALA